MSTGAQESPGGGGLDAIVVGTGFAGIQMAYELDQLGLSMQVIEAGNDVGGVWNWNRYPGARTDISAYQYCFSFSKELWQEWDWAERYPSQPEMLAYLGYAADRFDLRKHMRFNTRVESASYDETTDLWTVVTDAGDSLTAKYFVLATGGLSRPLPPSFEGLESFEGDWYVTSRWPQEPVEFAGKRVGVVGVGSTGVQVIPIVAEEAAHLTVFQRTPNYVVAAGNHPISAEDQDDYKSRYEEIREIMLANSGGINMSMPTMSYHDVSPEEARARLDESWQKGGLNVVLTFNDFGSSPEANEGLCEFIRSKIRSIVDDPETAELLCPEGYPFGAKRPPIGHHYYEAFNRENVTLVDVTDSPIERVTPGGVVAHGEEFPVDILIFALGFDAITGAALAMDIRGRGGESLEERWAGGPRTYLSCTVDGFPNMFLLAGPQSPFANQAMVIDAGVEWVTAAIRHEIDNDLAFLEPTAELVDEYCTLVDELASKSMVLDKAKEIHSFVVGANVEGKAQGAYFYYGPIPEFRDLLLQVARSGFEQLRPDDQIL